LPGTIFVRGFIRNYARLLRLDPGEILEAAERCLPHISPPPDRPRSRDIPFPGQERSRWPYRALAVLLAIGALAGYEFYWDKDGSRTPEEPTGSVTMAPEPAQFAAVPDMASAPAPAEPAGTAAAAPLSTTA